MGEKGENKKGGILYLVFDKNGAPVMQTDQNLQQSQAIRLLTRNDIRKLEGMYTFVPVEGEKKGRGKKENKDPVELWEWTNH